ncbi:SDR family oxidoreductase [Chondrinema litorale]|uniref:SDR family oxidoreductase n=1 Tax=Chondrinema litorale TaxID=2994555 RepID=UPI0025438FEF|nr:SDR family oxidoreductase [Chondrinema litorale]UZR97939.1 SDR family oxidoreductase [Chondrinema litorale]
MKVLLTGATGYIGKRLLPVLVDKGHQVICCVRDKKRFNPKKSILEKIEILEIDLLNRDTLKQIPEDIDAAYYLVHSMSSSGNYDKLEQTCVENFRAQLNQTKVKQVIYLSGIVNEDELSKHLGSRKNVETELCKGNYHCTTLRAGIIIGSGSASFEIIRDLVEKLPVMIAPKWLNTKCQPIAVADVITLLYGSLLNEAVYDKSFDIGGPDILTYKEMLLGFSKARNLDRAIFIVPVMTPRLSSYWLYFVTSTSYRLAMALVDSMKVEVICKNDDIKKIILIKDYTYQQALKRAFTKIESNEIVSSWKDSFASSKLNFNISDFIDVPTHGCFKDKRNRKVQDKQKTIQKLWRIGGNTGWYYGTWLWKIRGYMDKLVGGVGLRRGRTSPSIITSGDAIDFWRVLYANKEEGRLLLFAEMKLPGEAWLEFRINDGKLYQTATFRAKGILGRLYWYSVFPFHGFVFNGMISHLAAKE